jgi:hypothetical protein
MAMSVQYPRESRALHSDYYSGAKKSATHLNNGANRAVCSVVVANVTLRCMSSVSRHQFLNAARMRSFHICESADEMQVSCDS